MSTLRGIIVFALVTALTAACSSEKEPPAAESAHSAKPAQSEQDMRLSSLSDQFDRISSYAQDNPRELDKILIQAKNFRAEAAGTQFEKKAEKLAADAQARFNQDAEETYRKLREEADRLMARGKPRQTLEVLGEYPAEFFSTKWQKKIDEMIEPLKEEAEADRRFDILREDVARELEGHNPEAALDLVDRYPESMRTGSRKTQWDKMRSELSAKVEALREQRRKEEALPWEELFAGTSMNRWAPQSGKWELKAGVIVGKCVTDPQGFVYCGTEDSPWDNFILELEFKIVSGDFLVLGIRGKNEGGHSVFDQIEFRPENFPRAKFHEVTVEARGNVFTIREKGEKQVYTQDAESGFTKGPICFFIASGTEVHIRKVRIKHLK